MFTSPLAWLDLATEIGTSFFAPGSARSRPVVAMTERHADHCLFVPPTAPVTGAPMLVMLHGATQDPDDFALGTRMNEAAERHGFVVLYPAQNARQNPHRCWHWFDAAHQSRSSGDPARLAALTLRTAQARRIDRHRIFVAGMSAGGAMAALLGELYPEVYAAVGVHSGLAARCATDVRSGLAAMRGLPRTSGIRSGMPTIVFHGDKDGVVNPVNGSQVMDAAFGTDCLQETRESIGTGGRRFTRHTYCGVDESIPCAEHWILHGGAHGWSGGNELGSYIDPLGPDASEEMLRFFAGRPTRGVAAAGCSV